MVGKHISERRISLGKVFHNILFEHYRLQTTVQSGFGNCREWAMTPLTALTEMIFYFKIMGENVPVGAMICTVISNQIVTSKTDKRVGEKKISRKSFESVQYGGVNLKQIFADSHQQIMQFPGI